MSLHPTDLAPLIDAGVDIRLVAVDMDGTLLDGDGRVPPGLWPLLERMRERGVVFTPASGRQFATLRQEFADHADELVFIAENGSYVGSAAERISTAPMDRTFAHAVLDELAALDHEVGVVLCGVESAYVSRPDPAFRREAERYYARLDDVHDLRAVEDDILKLAVFDAEDGERRTAPALAHHRETHQVVVAGHHWVDVMNQGVSKGTALRALQQRLGVTPEQTAVFGDYLNDLDMLDAAHYSFAMANAHPQVVERARYRAPSNRDHGVVRVLERLLG